MAGPSRTTILVAALIWSVSTSSPVVSDDQGYQGVWVGDLEAGGSWWFLRFELTRKGDTVEGIASIPSAGLLDVNFSQINVTDNALDLVLSDSTESWRFQGVVHGNLLSGTAQFQDGPGEFRLFRTVPPTAVEIDSIVGTYSSGRRNHVFLARGERTDDIFLFDGRTRLRLFPLGHDRFFSPRGEQVQVARSVGSDKGQIIRENRFGIEVQYRDDEPYRRERSSFERGGTRLAGTLFLPHGPGPHPAVVLVHGLRPSTRKFEQLVAHQFAAAGIAAYFYSKSGPSFTFAELVEDALAAVKHLGHHQDLAPTQIGLVGLGEGGWITTLAAVRSDEVALVVTISSAAVSPLEQEQFLAAARVGLATGSARVIEIALNLVRLVFDLPAWAIEWPSVAAMRRLPATDLNYDPVPDLSRLQQPLLGLFGELDGLVPVGLSARRLVDLPLRAGNAKSSAMIFRRADHELFEVEAGSDLRWDAERRYAPGFWGTMIEWVTAVSDGADPPHLSSGALLPDDWPNEPTIPRRLSWFGSAPVQLGLVALFGFAFGSALVVLPIWALFRRSLRMPRDGTEGARLWAWTVSVWNVALLTGCVIFADRLLRLVAGDMVSVGRLLRVLVSLAAVSGVGALLMVWGSARVWRDGLGGQLFRSYLMLITAAALLVLPFVSFWDLIPFWR